MTTIISLIISWLIFVSSSSLSAEDLVQTKPGCQPKCGNISIPYPFGIGEACSLDSTIYGLGYNVTCDTSHNPPKPLLNMTTFPAGDEIFGISDTEIRIKSSIGKNCIGESNFILSAFLSLFFASSTQTPFVISQTKNRIFAVGCNTSFVVGMGMYGTETNSKPTCYSQCERRNKVIEGSCTGSGCCSTSIPKGVYNIFGFVNSNQTEIWSFNPCSYAFVAETDRFNFSALDLLNIHRKDRDDITMVFDWAIGNVTCREAQKNTSTYMCQGNSSCVDPTNNPGYRCECLKGYEGNPYLKPGCQDMNECEDEINNICTSICTNTLGSYKCSCPDGISGDGRKDGVGCMVAKHEFPILGVTLGIGLGIFVLLIIGSLCLYIIEKRKVTKHRKIFFEQNGGLLLKQKLSSNKVGVDSIKLFSPEDLKLATNNYDESCILGHGGYGTVYRGNLSDNRIVAIKKSQVVDLSQKEQFINELVVLSQINHRNVVKLIGCCLETEVPLLVYEYVSNGTLYEYIHHNDGKYSITWASLLRIASEIANALAYLHSSASVPVIHRDIKSTNVLLDENYNAKLSDFGASRLVPLDQTRLNTRVQGTFGYLDPEYFRTSQLTDKSDVYSFGVVLIELLTGEKSLTFERSKERSLADYFVSLLRVNNFSHLLDSRVLNEGKPEHVLAVAELAKKCLNLKGKDRPTMKQVAAKLESLRSFEKDTQGYQLSHKDFEKVPLQVESDLYVVPLGSYDATSSLCYSGQDSLEINATQYCL